MVWPQGFLLEATETLTGTPTITVRRDDGQTSDLTVSGTSASGSQVLLTLAGGTDGVTYTIGADCASTTSATHTAEGALAVSRNL